MREAPRAEVALPTNLADMAARDAEIAAWVAHVDDVVHTAAQRWSLQLGAPFQPGGQCSWVAPAIDADGTDYALKVGYRHDEALDEAAGLRAWKGAGAVLLHDAYTDHDTCALLLERCRPGAALASVLPATEQDVVVADLLRRLWITPPPGHSFRTLQSMCDTWAAEFDGRRDVTGLDPGLGRIGVELFVDLPRTAPRQVLLCTDLHAENILRAERMPWLAIDPKPFVGDPAYDVLQHLLNIDRLDDDPAASAHRMADLLELDADRVMQWLFARCVLESRHQPRLGAIATVLAPQ